MTTSPDSLTPPPGGDKPKSILEVRASEFASAREVTHLGESAHVPSWTTTTLLPALRRLRDRLRTVTGPDWAPTAFVWGVWASMLIGLLFYVGSCSADIPWQDEWNYVPIMTGDRPVTFRWLWEQHNDTRMMLPKLIWYSLETVAHWDPRAGMYLNALLLSALAMLMILGAKKFRRRLTYTDAFFPLMVMHVSHFDVLLQSLMVAHVLPIFITAVFLLVILLRGVPETPLGAVLAGIGLVLLSLSGGGEGVLFSLVLASCLAAAGIWKSGWWRTVSARWRVAGGEVDATAPSTPHPPPA
jgi:hypothetical protein